MGGLCSAHAVRHAMTILTIGSWTCVGFAAFVTLLFAEQLVRHRR